MLKAAPTLKKRFLCSHQILNGGPTSERNCEEKLRRCPFRARKRSRRVVIKCSSFFGRVFYRVLYMSLSVITTECAWNCKTLPCTRIWGDIRHQQKARDVIEDSSVQSRTSFPQRFSRPGMAFERRNLNLNPFFEALFQSPSRPQKAFRAWVLPLRHRSKW